MRIEIVSNQDVSDSMFDGMIALDHAFWPEGDPCFLSREYQESIYLPLKEGLFLAIDHDDNDRVVGYFNCIFVSEKQIEEYLNGASFNELENIHMHVGKDNICYLFTCNIDQKYRGTGCMKLLGKAFVKWLDMQEEKGCMIRVAYAEAVTVDGARTVSNGFGMKPLSDVDENGIGHYVSEDGLRNYRMKMNAC